MMKEKVMIENKEKCWGQKWNRKGTEQKQKMNVSGLIFREKMWIQGLTRNSRKSSKIKGLVTHTFSKKKKTREQKKKKRKIAEREKQKMSSPICWKKTTFFRYIKTGKE